MKGYLFLIWIALFLAPACAGKEKNGSGEKKTTEMPQPKRIVFFGNSLTAGFGIDPYDSYPSLIQEKIDSTGLSWKVVNAGISGETTEGGDERVDWVLKYPVDLFVLELGINDLFLGVPAEEAYLHLQSIVEKVRRKYPEATVLLIGVQATSYRMDAGFYSIYTDLAKAYRLPLVPSLLEGVLGHPDRVLADGLHPNETGHRIMAETVWEVLEPLIRE